MLLGARKIDRSTALNVVFDGNSFFAGTGASSGHTIYDQIMALVRVTFATAVSNNLGIGGQTTRQMDGLDGGSSADVDAAFDATRTNLLLVCETTNAIFNGGRTAAQAAGDMQSYVTNRLYAHPGWKIIIFGTIPRQGGATVSNQTDIDTRNATAVAADAIIQGNLRAWGAKAFVDMRTPGSPYRFPDYSTATFTKDDSLWYEAVGNRVHPTDAGYAFMAGAASRAVLNLPR